MSSELFQVQLSKCGSRVHFAIHQGGHYLTTYQVDLSVRPFREWLEHLHGKRWFSAECAKAFYELAQAKNHTGS